MSITQKLLGSANSHSLTCVIKHPGAASGVQHVSNPVRSKQSRAKREWKIEHGSLNNSNQVIDLPERRLETIYSMHSLPKSAIEMTRNTFTKTVCWSSKTCTVLINRFHHKAADEGCTWTRVEACKPKLAMVKKRKEEWETTAMRGSGRVMSHCMKRSPRALICSFSSRKSGPHSSSSSLSICIKKGWLALVFIERQQSIYIRRKQTSCNTPA